MNTKQFHIKVSQSLLVGWLILFASSCGPKRFDDDSTVGTNLNQKEGGAADLSRSQKIRMKNAASSRAARNHSNSRGSAVQLEFKAPENLRVGEPVEVPSVVRNASDQPVHAVAVIALDGSLRIQQMSEAGNPQNGSSKSGSSRSAAKPPSNQQEQGQASGSREQICANSYDRTQLSLFFETRYPGLNGAELELLSESASLQALERLAEMELLIDRRPQVLAPDTWYLYRKDTVAINELTRKQSELSVLALSIHPYYFNACHSLDGILLSIEMDDLEAYTKSVRHFTQAMLNARQLSFETDRLLDKLFGEVN